MRRLPLLFLVLAACGDDSARKIADAPAGPHDSPPLIDSPPQQLQVLVTVTNPDGTPVPGVHVYFQNADSSVVGETLLDASGNARQQMNPGGFVTAMLLAPAPPGLLGAPATRYLAFTWAGVKPGDHLLLSPPASSEPSPTIPMTITIPLDAVNAATVTEYAIQSTCSYTSTFQPPTGSGATNTVVGVSFWDGCTAADVLVTALDSANHPVSSFSISGQPITANGTIDYTLQTYAAAAARSYTFTNNPDVASTISFQDQYITGRGVLYDAGSTSAATEDPATATVTMPLQPQGTLDVISAIQYTTGTIRNVFEWGTTGAYTQDWGMHLLPDFTGAPTFDTGTHVASWTTAGGTATVDYSLVGLESYRGTTNTLANWGIAVPSGTQAAFPNLPTDVADINPAATDEVTIMDVRTFKVPGGYDAARGNVFQTTTPVPTGASGTCASRTWPGRTSRRCRSGTRRPAVPTT